MTLPIGTKTAPLRVAIIGSGPSAFYAAGELQKQDDLVIDVDMFERLPTPFGLVRGGVAPDHPKIKAVTKVYDQIASHPNFRFWGNVTFGRDITYADLTAHFHAIIYATGAQTDRPMNIPGENLPGSHAATEFVAWYNAHPDYRDDTFDLSQERVAVIGNGNVAMDVVRVLARSEAALRQTDIADYALEALSRSRVKEILMLGRRGPAQAKFTNPELKELEELTDADVIIAPEEIELDELSREFIRSGKDRSAERNVQMLMEYAHQQPAGRPKQIIMRFLVSPVEIIGTDHVEAIKLVKNELYQRADGSLRPRPTGEIEIIPVGLVFRSIGYHGVALPDVPFDETNGIIPNRQGRVIDADQPPRTGEYVTGWIKRGPIGIIGTNKPDAHETISQLCEDVRQGVMLRPSAPDREAVGALLNERHTPYVTYDDYRILDQIEQERGQAAGRPRVKFSRVADMLAALAAHKGDPA